MKIETMQDLNELVRIVDYMKLPFDNFLFVHQGTKDKIDAFLVDIFKNGATAYGAFNGKGELTKQFQFQSVTIGGYTFHITTCPDEMPEYIAQTLGKIEGRANKLGYKPLETK